MVGIVIVAAFETSPGLDADDPYSGIAIARER